MQNFHDITNEMQIANAVIEKKTKKEINKIIKNNK